MDCGWSCLYWLQNFPRGRVCLLRDRSLLRNITVARIQRMCSVSNEDLPTIDIHIILFKSVFFTLTDFLRLSWSFMTMRCYFLWTCIGSHWNTCKRSLTCHTVRYQQFQEIFPYSEHCGQHTGPRQNTFFGSYSSIKTFDRNFIFQSADRHFIF